MSSISMVFFRVFPSILPIVMSLITVCLQAPPPLILKIIHTLNVYYKVIFIYPQAQTLSEKQLCYNKNDIYWQICLLLIPVLHFFPVQLQKSNPNILGKLTHLDLEQMHIITLAHAKILLNQINHFEKRRRGNVGWTCLTKHRKNCECCPVSDNKDCQVLNCQNCNQCLKCHKP